MIKTLRAIPENLMIQAILLGGFALVAAILLLLAGHLGLIWTLAYGMVSSVVLAIAAYAALTILEPKFKLNTHDNPNAYLVVNLAASAGITVAWAYSVGQFMGGADASAGLLGTLLLHAVGLVSVWITANAICQLFNGQIYALGSYAAGLIVYLLVAMTS